MYSTKTSLNELMAPSLYFSFLVLLFLLPLFLLVLLKRNQNPKKLPPGPLGLPIIGQTLAFQRALHRNTAEEWLKDRIKKYGPISKLGFIGYKTVLIHGQAANKFIFTSDTELLSNQHPESFRRTLGEKNILELIGHEHKRVRGALTSFLKPEVLKQYVGRMDEETRNHFRLHWHGNQKVSVLPLMKVLTFNILCSLIIGVEQGAKREKLANLFYQLLDGSLSIPINLPFTRFNRSLKARAQIRTMILDLIREKRAALEHRNAFPQKDLITSLLSLRNDDNSALLSDEEIVDNATTVLVAGHDTSSALLVFMVRILATEPSVYAGVVQEQEEIAKSKASGEPLTWGDLAKMKYTWSVAMETLRMYPPAFFTFRRVVQDFEYQGYHIPKGWQVLTFSILTQMDANNFPDPTKFDPRRLEKTPAPPYTLVPFGSGPRMCPGYEFARIETLVAIHYLATHFTWKLCSTDLSFSREPLPNFPNGMEIQIEPKKVPPPEIH